MNGGAHTTAERCQNCGGTGGGIPVTRTGRPRGVGYRHDWRSCGWRARVAKHQLHAGFARVTLVETLERRVGANRHKGRRVDDAVRRGDAADARPRARLARTVKDFEFEKVAWRPRGELRRRRRQLHRIHPELLRVLWRLHKPWLLGTARWVGAGGGGRCVSPALCALSILLARQPEVLRLELQQCLKGNSSLLVVRLISGGTQRAHLLAAAEDRRAQRLGRRRLGCAGTVRCCGRRGRGSAHGGDGWTCGLWTRGRRGAASLVRRGALTPGEGVWGGDASRSLGKDQDPTSLCPPPVRAFADSLLHPAGHSGRNLKQGLYLSMSTKYRCTYISYAPSPEERVSPSLPSVVRLTERLTVTCRDRLETGWLAWQGARSLTIHYSN